MRNLGAILTEIIKIIMKRKLEITQVLIDLRTNTLRGNNEPPFKIRLSKDNLYVDREELAKTMCKTF